MKIPKLSPEALYNPDSPRSSAEIDEGFNRAMEIAPYRRALREIKLTALTATDGPAALAHIIKLCIKAGIKDGLDDLREL